MYSRNALSIAVGASSGSSSLDAKSMSTKKLTLMSPIVSVTGSISLSTRRTAGSRQSMTMVSEPSRRRSQGTGSRSKTKRAEQHDRRVEIKLGILVLDPRDTEEEPEDDHEVPRDRSQSRERKVVIRVQDPHDDPREPEQHDRREEHAREADGEIEVSPRIAERTHQNRREEDEERGHRAEAEERQPEERRGDTPRALLLASLEELAEDRDEGSGERRVGDQGADKVRNLDRDREGVDLPRDAEVVGADHLPHQPEGPGDSGSKREDGRRARDAPVVAGLLLKSGNGLFWRLFHGLCRAILPVGPATIARPADAGVSRSKPRDPLANIKQQKKRVRIQARQRLENLRYRSTIKTLTKRLEAAAGDGDAERIATEHRELVRTIDRAATRGALHRNTAARKKSQAAKLAASASS